MPEPRTSPAAAPTLLREVLDATAQTVSPPPAPLTLVGECLEMEHPVLHQRVKIAWVSPDGEPSQAWLAPLRNMVIRAGDRVLLTLPANWPEPLVTGVLDGLHQPARPPLRQGPSVRLRADEGLRVTSEDGHDLLEIRQADTGPVLRLLGEDMDLEFPGRLRLCASEIALEARRGDVRIDASDDVKVRGEVIELN